MQERWLDNNADEDDLCSLLNGLSDTLHFIRIGRGKDHLKHRK